MSWGDLLCPSDARLSWDGAVSVEHTKAWSRAWRLPHDALPLFPGDRLLERAKMAACVRIRFVTSATALGLVADPVPGGDSAEVSPVDLVVDRSVRTFHVGDGPMVTTMPGTGTKAVEIWLPQFGELRIRGIEVNEGAAVGRPQPHKGPRLVVYGSSIEQGRSAGSPTKPWPAIVARTQCFDVTSLGFDGECHLDPLLVPVIADLKPSMVVCSVGINVYSGGTFNRRSFRPAVLGFVDAVRRLLPSADIVVISPIGSASREHTTGAAEMSLAEVRQEVHSAVETLQKHYAAAGIRSVYLVDGRQLLAVNEGNLLADGLHPSAEGHERIAHRLNLVKYLGSNGALSRGTDPPTCEHRTE